MTDHVRYITWDYDNGVAIEYERSGECNGCGACCMAMVAFNIKGVKWETNHDAGMLGTQTDGTGLWHEIRRGSLRRMYGHVDITEGTACSQLDENFRCKIYDARPLLHTTWPISPFQVTPFKDCSYSFTEIGRWPIDECPVDAPGFVPIVSK